MRKLAIVCSAAFLLSGCVSVGGVGGASIGEIMKQTQAICGFVPYAKVVADILAKEKSWVVTAKGIADAICSAVTINPKAEGPGGRRQPTVNGVVVKGRFV